MLVWLVGLLCGAIGTGYVLVRSFYTRIIAPALARQLPRKSRPPPVPLVPSSSVQLPRALVEKLVQLDAGQHDTESAEWLNMLISWFFDQMRDSSALRDGFFEALARSAVDMRRRPLGRFLVRVPSSTPQSDIDRANRCWRDWQWAMPCLR